MRRFIIPLLLLSVVVLPLHSGFALDQKANAAPAAISIAKSGAIMIGRERIRLKDLLSKLGKMGVSGGSKISVQGDEGAKPSDINKVMEMLATGGLLPANSID
jgi:biopolymer transport protein ExbD